jgi:thiol:disulfide interchange protein DsbD
MIAFALSFFGFWEFRVPAGLTRLASRSYRGYFGTFFMGLTLGIVAAPCLGPFLIGLLTYVGQKGDPFLGFLYFFVLSIGLGLPLSILAVFSGAVNRLPMSGDWLIWIRRCMAWVMVGMAAYILSPLLANPLGKSGPLAFVSICAGLHLGWLERTGGNLRRFSPLRKILGIVLIAGGISYFAFSALEREGIKWIPYDQALISRAAKEGKPMILDFYADWCGPCRVMEKKVFKDPEVLELSRGLTAMRLDLTRRHPNQAEILKRYRVSGVPTVIFLNREGEEEKALRIESFIDKSEFLERVRQILKKSPPKRE